MCGDETRTRLSPRAARLLRDFTCLLAIAALVYWLRETTAAIEHPRAPRPVLVLDFKLVKERFGKISPSASRNEVEKLLGPPSPPNEHWEADLQWWAESGDSRVTGDDRVWDLWIDPGDQGRGVAIERDPRGQ
jgi:hypothetical protein